MPSVYSPPSPVETPSSFQIITNHNIMWLYWSFRWPKYISHILGWPKSLINFFHNILQTFWQTQYLVFIHCLWFTALKLHGISWAMRTRGTSLHNNDLGEWHWNMYIIICEMNCQSRFNAWDRMLRAGALGWTWGTGWGGWGEGGSGWGTHVYPWQIHVNVWLDCMQYQRHYMSTYLLGRANLYWTPCMNWYHQINKAP